MSRQFPLLQNSTQKILKSIQSLFSTVGVVHNVPESLLDAVTAVSGSGPGYVALLIDALADGGVQAGLPRQLALDLAVQTFAGTATLIADYWRPPSGCKRPGKQSGRNNGRWSFSPRKKGRSGGSGRRRRCSSRTFRSTGAVHHIAGWACYAEYGHTSTAIRAYRRPRPVFFLFYFLRSRFLFACFCLFYARLGFCSRFGFSWRTLFS